MSAPHQAMMAASPGPPTPLGTFTFNSSEAAMTIAWPSGHQSGDLGILFVASANQVVSTPAGWNVINTPIGQGSAGSTRSTTLYAFWRRATSSSEADASIADSGLEQIAVMNVFRGADLTASPIEAVVSGIEVTPSNPFTVPSTTTLGPNRYVVAGTSGGGQPASTNQANCTYTTNANLSNFVELADSAFKGLGGVGGSVAAFGGLADQPLATGTTSGLLADTGNREHCIFAIKPQ